ncbi:MAG: hypothetical protein MJZ68_01545 [archaeon]|nr:hypothetical protein [archaeon]
MALQWGLAAFGPVGIVAAVGITLLMGVAACEMADDYDYEDSPFYEWTHSDKKESTHVVTPSVTPSEAEDYYHGGELPTVPEQDRKEEEVPVHPFNPDTYKPGELAPKYDLANPWGFVCVTPELLGPNEEVDEEDDSTQMVSSSFRLSAEAYESGAKYILIFVCMFLGVFWGIQMLAQYRREQEW